MLEIPDDDIEEGRMRNYVVSGAQVLVARASGVVYAMGGKCKHLGCTLAQGRLEGTTVICPCHGSTWDLTSGKLIEAVTKWPKIVRGPIGLFMKDEPSYKVEVTDGTIRVNV